MAFINIYYIQGSHPVLPRLGLVQLPDDDSPVLAGARKQAAGATCWAEGHTPERSSWTLLVGRGLDMVVGRGLDMVVGRGLDILLVNIKQLHICHQH